MDTIVDGSNRQEPVNIYFDGDDLFMPFERRRGLPIGNLTSQFFANLYLDGFDHFVTEVLRAPYVRYVDDFALFHNDADVLAEWRRRIEHYFDWQAAETASAKTVISNRRPFRPSFSASSFIPEVAAGCRTTTCGASVTGCGVARPMARRNGRARRHRGPHWRLDRARGQRRYVAPAPRDLPGRLVRSGPQPGGLDGPLSPCRSRRFLEQQSEEPPRRRPQQEHPTGTTTSAFGLGVRFSPEPARSRSRRVCTKRPGPSMMMPVRSKRGRIPRRRLSWHRKGRQMPPVYRNERQSPKGTALPCRLDDSAGRVPGIAGAVLRRSAAPAAPARRNRPLTTKTPTNTTCGPQKVRSDGGIDFAAAGGSARRPSGRAGGITCRPVCGRLRHRRDRDEF